MCGVEGVWLDWFFLHLLVTARVGVGVSLIAREVLIPAVIVDVVDTGFRVPHNTSVDPPRAMAAVVLSNDNWCRTGFNLGLVGVAALATVGAGIDVASTVRHGEIWLG